MPSKDLLDELLRQVLTAKKDAALKIELSKDHEIRRYKDEIYLVRKNQNNKKITYICIYVYINISLIDCCGIYLINN